jgi:nucleoside-diphosphate-sugar epimerase
MTSPPTLMCFGFGYCAQHYVAEFGARYGRVVGTVRTAHKAQEFASREFAGHRIEVLTFDGENATREVIAGIEEADRLLMSIPPTETHDPVLACCVGAVAAAPRLESILYLSTIGVYGDYNGEWVDESTPPKAAEARARARLAAEEAWQACGARGGKAVAILRLAGIYGPGRNALNNVARGVARRVVKPGHIFNRIHVRDIAQTIDAAFTRHAVGTFNVADDAPCPPAEPIEFAASLLGIPPPPEISFAQAAPTMSAMALSFYAESRRVRNDKLKRALGITLHYPSFKEGLTALHASGEPGGAR